MAHPPEISPEKIGRIVNFLGYGRPSAPVWFMGIEEGLGKMDAGDISANLNARSGFESTMDLWDAHIRLHEKGRPIDIENQSTFTPVWLWMGEIMVAREGDEDWSDLVSADQKVKSQARDRIRERAKQYIQYQLGRSYGKTFLTELSPIPAAKVIDRSFKKWLQANDTELERKITRRRDALKRMLKENPKALVICYGNGRDSAQKFAKFFEIEWQSVPNCPTVSRSSDSKYVLLPFFGNGRMRYSVLVDLIRSGLLG